MRRKDAGCSRRGDSAFHARLGYGSFNEYVGRLGAHVGAHHRALHRGTLVVEHNDPGTPVIWIA